MDKTHILVVDDDIAILRLLQANLKARGYRVTCVQNGEQALETMEMDFVDLIILDLMMPGIDGVEVCRRIRSWSQVPIIILSARGDEQEKVKCLELGSDDYITKPFSISELIARIKNALRHATNPASSTSPVVYKCGELEINYALRRVTVHGEEVRLTPVEFAVLQQLTINTDKVLTHSMLLKSVWGQEYSLEKEYLRVFIHRLRKKLENRYPDLNYIKTIPGVGYHMTSPMGN